MTSLNRTNAGPVSRRTVAKAAAWSLPVVATAAAAPMASASAPVEDVDVSASCYGLTIAGFGFSLPQFSIIAVGAPIAAGSTFTLTGDGLANLTIGGDTAIIDVGILAHTSRTITIKKTIPVGGLATVKVTGLLSAQVLKTYTLSVNTIIGNANTNHTNDSASQQLTGLSLGPIVAGYCGSRQAVAVAHQRNVAKYHSLSAHQKQQLVRQFAAHR